MGWAGAVRTTRLEQRWRQRLLEQNATTVARATHTAPWEEKALVQVQTASRHLGRSGTGAGASTPSQPSARNVQGNHNLDAARQTRRGAGAAVCLLVREWRRVVGSLLVHDAGQESLQLQLDEVKGGLVSIDTMEGTA